MCHWRPRQRRPGILINTTGDAPKPSRRCRKSSLLTGALELEPLTPAADTSAARQIGQNTKFKHPLDRTPIIFRSVLQTCKAIESTPFLCRSIGVYVLNWYFRHRRNTLEPDSFLVGFSLRTHPRQRHNCKRQQNVTKGVSSGSSDRSCSNSRSSDHTGNNVNAHQSCATSKSASRA